MSVFKTNLHVCKSLQTLILLMKNCHRSWSLTGNSEGGLNYFLYSHVSNRDHSPWSPFTFTGGFQNYTKTHWESITCICHVKFSLGIICYSLPCQFSFPWTSVALELHPCSCHCILYLFLRFQLGLMDWLGHPNKKLEHCLKGWWHCWKRFLKTHSLFWYNFLKTIPGNNFTPDSKHLCRIIFL